ncbi:MAG: thiamine pyrophosphate-binding protein [Nitrospirota bacterium]
MKLSDYVASFLAKQGIRHVFVISGGASVHLIHSLGSTPGITFVCPQHEQAGAMAADAYSRVTRDLGAAISTSGPGATNMITGVCSAYYDSIPVIYITGQVSTFRLAGNTGVRQMGFQETDVVNIYKPITKYAVQIDNPQRIRYELEKACHLARTGRPGPVVLDIPDNIQREQLDPDKLESFIPKQQNKDLKGLNNEVEQCASLLEKAKRPIIILGWGIRLAKADKEAEEFINKLGFPVAPTWAMADILPFDHPLLVGTFGTHGTRYANFAVQNADLVLSIGARLDTKATGSPMTTFAREAKKIIVDVDPSELSKFDRFGMDVELLINADAKDYFYVINQMIAGIKKQDISEWIEQIAIWKKKYPICLPEYYKEEDVNPYVFVKSLSKKTVEGDVIITDTGCALAWLMQAFDFKANQRIYHDWNNTAMGWALPASIGACFALDRKPIICVTGDGSLQMNIQELATVLRHQLPIKIFLINNHGYSMIQQTQDQWLDSKYLASTVEGGLAFPDFVKVAKAYGYKTTTISRNRELNRRIRDVLDNEGPVFCNVEIKPEHRVIPQVKFGRPNEDAEPLLERKEFLKNMIVKPIKKSLI